VTTPSQLYTTHHD